MLTNIRITPGLNLLAVIIILIAAVASSCSSSPTATPFRPPVAQTQPDIALETLAAQPVTPLVFETPTFIIPPLASPTPCTNNLTYLQDLTIPDNTEVSPGSQVDKQWLVQNTGNCNWNSSYRLKWISGDALGATIDQALYPARAGTQATIRIVFTAPSSAGSYESEWQAYDSNGNAFGDSFFIRIVVQ